MLATQEFDMPNDRPPTPIARNSLLYFGACAKELAVGPPANNNIKRSLAGNRLPIAIGKARRKRVNM
jgi:hypothetical protein